MKFVSIIIALLFIFSNIKISYSQVVINEFLASNEKNIINFSTQTYDDWIELHNISSTDFDLSSCYLTDNLTNPTKWKFPANTIIKANGFLVVWANSVNNQLNTNFNLSASGEEIGLFSATLSLIDSVRFGQQLSDISFGRWSEEKGQKVFFKIPTFEKANSASQYFWGIAQKPSFVSKSGFYNSLSVEIIPNTSGDSIYYTTDNSTPTRTSNLYKAPFLISKNTNVRAVSVRQKYLNSFTISASYFINEPQSKLPIWSITTDSVNLYGNTGIYSHPWTDGLECEVDNIFIKNNLEDFNIKSGLRIQGSSSVGMPKKSFREFYKSSLGNEYLNYNLFSLNNLAYFKNTVLRAGYDDDLTDGLGTLLRDPLSSDLWRKTGGLTSLSEWSVLYLNSKYWGIYNVRESINEYFIEHHTGSTNFELVRYQKEGAEIKYGNGSEWQKLVSFFNTTDFSKENSFYAASEFIDMPNFINLLAFVHCTQYRSWTWGSFAYKEYSPNGRWRWTIWDTDRSYSTLSWNGFTEYQYLTAEKWSNFMPQKLIQNEIFKHKLVNRIADLLNSEFLPDKAIASLDSVQSIIEPEIRREITRWTTISYTTWLTRVENLRTFFKQRPTYLRNQILSYFSLAATKQITLNIEGKGYIQINTIKPTQYPWQGIYFQGVAIELTAVPAQGFKFLKWSNDASGITIKIMPENFSELTAFFVEDTAANNNKPLVINEINYNSAPIFDTEDWIEIYNPNLSSVNLANWTLNDNNEFNRFIFPEKTTILTESFLVVCKDTNQFKIRFPEISNYIGNINFGFGTSDEVKIYNSDNLLVDFVSYTSSAPWSPIANGSGASLELVSPDKNNELAENWIAILNYYGTPGKKNRVLLNNIDVSINDEICVFPSPATDFVHVNIPANQSGKLRFFDLSGKLQLQTDLKQQNNQVDIQSLTNGFYMLQIVVKEGVFNYKILKIN